MKKVNLILKMDENIPRPTRIWDVKKIIQLERQDAQLLGTYDLEHRKYILDKFSQIMSELGKEKTSMTKANSYESSICNSYSVINSMIQCNEAINKLICASEIMNYYQKGNLDDRICPSYKGEFSGGTIIPALYYSEMSTIMSTMSLLGCIFYREDEEDYNIIRKNNYWDKKTRRDFVYKFTNNKSHGPWHDVFLYILEGFQNKHDLFSHIDIQQFKKLQNCRNEAHYSILGSTTAYDSMASSDFFYHFPLVYNSIKDSLFALKIVWGDQLPGFSGIERFETFSNNIEKLFENTGYEHVISKLNRF